MPPLLRPQPLRAGDLVAVVSPAWGPAGPHPRRFDRGVAALRRHLGLRVRVMPNARLSRSWSSASPAERLADLHAAFADPEVRAVWSAAGGSSSAQLLDGLDVGLVAANPKVFLGYSDVTALHAAIGATGLVTFYGPTVFFELGEWPRPHAYTLEHLRRAVMSDAPVGPVEAADFVVDESVDYSDDEHRPRARRPAAPLVALRDGRASGPLLAGCLPVATQLVGTPWQAEHTGRVLMLETHEGAREAERDLWHLRNAGLLADLAALVVGRAKGDEAEQAALHAVVLEAAEPYRYPVLANLDCAHTDPMATLPIGVRATVDGATFTVDEPGCTPVSR